MGGVLIDEEQIVRALEEEIGLKNHPPVPYRAPARILERSRFLRGFRKRLRRFHSRIEPLAAGTDAGDIG